MLLALGAGSSLLGLAASSRDALVTGFLASLAAILLLVTGAVRSGPSQRDRQR
ncbi:MAG: hypothetical protein ACKO8G_01125 [Actinomycetota bacterium]